MQRDSNIVCFCSMKLKKIYRFFKYHLWSDEFYVKRNFYKSHGYKLDLNNPQTLCEKIQWLKLHDRRDFNTLCADKYLAPQYIGKNSVKIVLFPYFFQQIIVRIFVLKICRIFPLLSNPIMLRGSII